MNISTASLSGGFISKFTQLWGYKWRNRKVIHFLKSQGIEFSQCYEIYTKKKHFLFTLKMCYLHYTGFLPEPLQWFLQLFSKSWRKFFGDISKIVNFFQNFAKSYIYIFFGTFFEIWLKYGLYISLSMRNFALIPKLVSDLLYDKWFSRYIEKTAVFWTYVQYIGSSKFGLKPRLKPWISFLPIKK